MVKTKTNYRAGRGGDVLKAWLRWKKAEPCEEHSVVSFTAGYNAAMLDANQGYRIVQDGDQWCCTGPGFTNLQESIVGFGRTATLALDAYHAAVVRAVYTLLEGEQ